MKYVCLLVVGFVLFGCEADSSVTDGPLYTLVNEQDYGYEASEGQVLFYRYLGTYDGEVQMLSKHDSYTYSLLLMKPPYEFFTEVGLYQTTVTRSETRRLQPNMLASYMLSDALNGNLTRYRKDQWVDEDNVSTPHYLRITKEYQPEWVPINAGL